MQLHACILCSDIECINVQPGLAAAADGQKEQKKEKVDSLGARQRIRTGSTWDFDGMKPEISYKWETRPGKHSQFANLNMAHRNS